MKRFWIGATAVVLALALGCAEQSRTGRVTGRVTLDGVPLEDGSIRLAPIDGKGTTAGAEIIDGSYTINDAPATTVRVEISAPKVVGKRKQYDTPDSPMIDIIKERVPARYNAKSELKKDIQRGDQVLNFELSSK